MTQSGVLSMSDVRPSRGTRSSDEPAVLRVPAVCSVLIADDEHLVATGISAMVKELGHSVAAVASDGEIALTLARQHKPDLALLDIRMPRVQGIDVAAQLHRELAIPSIIISAYSDKEHLEAIRGNGAHCGVYGYLIKPIDADDLRVTMGVALIRSASERLAQSRVDQLERNIANRRLVEQAKWILVQKRQFTEQQAHERLQRAARDQRRSLAEIAAEVIERGDMKA